MPGYVIHGDAYPVLSYVLYAPLAWLAFPPLLIIASTGTTDVALAAMLAFVLLMRRRPAASTAISVGLVLAVGGTDGVWAMVHSVDLRLDRGSLEDRRAVVLALLAGTTVHLWRSPEQAAEPQRIAALAGRDPA